MPKTIFFVDDDASAYRAWLAELELAGFTVEAVTNADAAFNRLWNVDADDVALVVIDVLLAVEDHTSRFSEERTRNYLETGLRLLDELVEQNSAVFPRRAVLLTSSMSYETLGSVRRTCAEYAIPLWRKSEIVSPLDIRDRIVERQRQLNEAPAA
jgi:CheY-like chemotaxis protein